ncbi:MAG TPA: hypothetical protein VGI73_06125 [Solirubrobacterales bacterium]|jgi:heme-degrading monooxygenase HmoA
MNPAHPLVMIFSLEGDPDDLLERFERARLLWVAEDEDDRSLPIFHAACKTKEGITVVTAWETNDAHKAFARGVSPHLKAVGLGTPDRHEHLRIAQLGWK